MNSGRRKSTLKSQEEFLFGDDADLDFSVFIDPFLEIKEEYEALAVPFRKNRPKAYMVTYKGLKGLLFICFTTNRYKAKGEATKYFRNNMHPDFIENQWRIQHLKARSIRMKEFDKYANSKLVPIPELMKLGAKFPCSVCGRELFSYKDYEDKRCYIVEDEGNLNVFTRGYVFCYDCYKRFYEEQKEENS